jgi:hypothetical protein
VPRGRRTVLGKEGAVPIVKIGGPMCDLCVPYYLGKEGAVRAHRKCRCVAQCDNATPRHKPLAPPLASVEPGEQQPAYRRRVERIAVEGS